MEINHHGLAREYLLSLTEDFDDHELIGQPPCFELNLVESQTPDASPAQVLDFSTYTDRRRRFSSLLRSLDLLQLLATERLFPSFGEVLKLRSENDLRKHVSQELQNIKPKPRLIWEVYAGASRLAEVAESLGCQVESFWQSNWLGF